MTTLDAADWSLPNGVDVRLAQGADEGSVYLPAREHRHISAYRSVLRQRQSRLGRWAARTLAAERLGLGPRDVPLVTAGDGAPEVDGLYVSIAHTSRGGDPAALAAVASGPVGVDLERIGSRRPDLWTRILRPDEHVLLDQLGGPTDEVQTLLWVLKEAVLKGQRTGFRAGTQSVRLALDAAASPHRGVATAEARDSGPWTVSFGRQRDLWLAVAWLGGPRQRAVADGQEKQTR
ncbi:MAG: 4'-phosphopantetheinyl transferase superfamily protein [Bacteroidota bacterium]